MYSYFQQLVFVKQKIQDLIKEKTRLRIKNHKGTIKDEEDINAPEVEEATRKLL